MKKMMVMLAVVAAAVCVARADSLVGQNNISPVLSKAAITATAVVTAQRVSLTDTNGVTASVMTNATVAVTIVNGGAVVTNMTLKLTP